MLANFLTLLVIVVVIALACLKLFIDKKNGIQCSGCPYSNLGNHNCHCSDPSVCSDNYLVPSTHRIKKDYLNTVTNNVHHKQDEPQR